MNGRVLFVACLALTGLPACGAEPSAKPQESRGYAEGLHIASGGVVTAATYTIDGPNGFSSAGTVPVGDSPDVSVVVSNLPVGQGYELAVGATASDGVTVCQGSSSFDVTSAGSTSTVVVHLECAVPSGDVQVTGTINLCPVIDDLTALPVVLGVGAVSNLSMVARDDDGGPNVLSYGWTVNGVRLARQNTQNLAFTCTSVGDVTLGAVASDGDPDPTCAATASVKVSCE